MNRTLLTMTAFFLFSLTAQAQQFKPIEHATCKSTATGVIMTLGASASSLTQDAYAWQNGEVYRTYFRSKGFEISGGLNSKTAQEGDLNTHIGVFCERKSRYSNFNCTFGVTLSRKDKTQPSGYLMLATNSVKGSFASAAHIDFAEQIRRAGDRIPICNTTAAK